MGQPVNRQDSLREEQRVHQRLVGLHSAADDVVVQPFADVSEPSCEVDVGIDGITIPRRSTPMVKILNG